MGESGAWADLLDPTADEVGAAVPAILPSARVLQMAAMDLSSGADG